MKASLISLTEGFGLLSSNSVALIIMPLWQKPQSGTCSSIHACCTGWSMSLACASDRCFCLAHRAGNPSRVVISLPIAVEAGVTQERISFPSSSTEHAPHCARPQPNCESVDTQFIPKHIEKRGVLR